MRNALRFRGLATKATCSALVVTSALLFLLPSIAVSQFAWTNEPGNPLLSDGGGDGNWDDIFVTKSPDGPVWAIEPWEGKLAVAGSFSAAGAVALKNIALWDGTSWSPLGEGLPDRVLGLAVIEGILYAGGDFDYVARWDGTSWVKLGLGMSADVEGLVVHNGELYACGDFTYADGQKVNNVAKWNGTTWVALGPGLGYGVTELGSFQGELYAGGAYFEVPGYPGNRDLARWNGTEWRPVGSGEYGKIEAFAKGNGSLYVGGNITSVGGVLANNIGRWDGVNWHTLGEGLNGPVFALEVIQGQVFAGGAFTKSGATNVNHIAMWNGSSWSPLGSGVNGDVYTGMAAVGLDLYVGGIFGIALWHQPPILDFWVSLNGPTGGQMNAVAQDHNGYIFGATFNSGLYRSTNSGGTWTSISANIFQSLLIGHGGVIIGGTDGVGIIRSTDGGTSWASGNAGLSDVTFPGLAIDRSGNLYAGGWQGGVFRSSDNGQLWSTLAVFSGFPVYGFAFKDGGVIFASTTGGGIRRSTDNGASWSIVNNGLTNINVQSVTVDRLGRVLAGTDVGVFRSTDNGGSWNKISQSWTSQVHDVIVAGDGDIFAGTFQGVYISTDDGNSWALSNSGLTNTNVGCAIVGPDGHMIVGTWGGGVFRSADPVEVGPPTISAFSPVVGKIGDVITLSGSNFSADPAANIVHFGAVRAAVAAASTNNMQVLVPPGAAHALLTVTVRGLTAYSPRPFAPTFAGMGVLDTMSFGPVQTFQIGQYPRWGTVADLDVDGKPDLVETNGEPTPSYVSILPNKSTVGKIDFGPRVDLPNGARPYQIAYGDLNGDGKLDLVSANNSSNNISTFLNISTPGVFAFNRQDFPMHAVPQGAAIADLDGDGRSDIVATNQAIIGLSIFHNTSLPGSFSLAPRVDYNTGQGSYRMALVDIDGDGKLDICVANSAGHGDVTSAVIVFRNLSTPGTIALAPYVSFPSLMFPGSIVSSDVDGDGLPDLIFGPLEAKKVSVLKNMSTPGTIAFAPRIDLDVPVSTWGVAVGDLDGDRKEDISATNTNGTKISLLRNLSTPGSISFASPINVPTASNPFEGRVADLDLDGKPDLISAGVENTKVMVLRNRIGEDSIKAVPLVIRSGLTDSVSLLFGFARTATPGIDRSLGEQELPPPPPAGVIDGRFVLPVTPALSSPRDFRSDTSSSVVWRITFQPGSAGYPIILRWGDLIAYPGYFTLRDEVTGSIVYVNMKFQTSYSLTNMGITSLRIEYSKILTRSVGVASGWNLLSVPLLAQDMSVGAIFPAAASPAYTFQGGYVTVSSLATGKGYWLKFGSATNFQLSGQKAPTGIPLMAGWQIIGPLEVDVPVSSLTTNPPGLVQGSFWGYSGGYIQTSTLQSGKGYWVKSYAPGSIQFPGSPHGGVPKLAEIPTAVESDDPAFGFHLAITDGSGARQQLFGGVSPLATDTLDRGLTEEELPPLPPAGVFDARFIGSDIGVSLGLGTLKDIRKGDTSSTAVILHEIVYQVGTGSSITVSWDLPQRLTGRLQDFVTGSVVDRVMTGRDSLVISNPGGIPKLKLTMNYGPVVGTGEEVRQVPTEFSLSPNYPNPFNPSTTIRYGLPSRSHVTLTVFNTLGQQVATLVQGERQAGFHEVRFDASNLSSGVYLYRLQAGTFVETRKLLLLR